MTGATRTRTARTVLRWSARLVLLAFLLLVTAAIAVVVVIPRMTHGAALTVLTGSMTPDIPVGSVVVVRPVDPQTLEAGDVATYQPKPDNPALITHRVVKVKQTDRGLELVFKGDANPGRDLEPVVPGQIRGEVWFHVPYLGGIRDALHGKGGISLVAMLLLAGYALTQISGGLRDRRAASQGPIELRIDRPLVVARLRHTSLAPLEHARAWGGLLVETNDTDFTLVIAPPADGLAATLELLQDHDPVDIRVWDAPSTLSGSSVTIRDAAPSEEAHHVVG